MLRTHSNMYCVRVCVYVQRVRLRACEFERIKRKVNLRTDIMYSKIRRKQKTEE